MRTDALLERAQQAGLLPPQAQWPAASESRPWPVLVLTAIGAWFVALPLLAFIGILLGAAVRDSAALPLIGLALLAVAALLLRDRAVPLFVEQLALPLLLVGLLCMGWWLVEQFERVLGFSLLAALILLLALPLQRPWLRALLGLAAACCFWVTSWPLSGSSLLTSGSAAGAGLVLAWAFAVNLPLAPAWRSGVEAVGQGWLAGALVLLAGVSGSGWLVGGLGLPRGGQGPGWVEGLGGGLSWFALVLALAALALLAHAWPALRAPRRLVLLGSLALLALLMPQLGPVLLAAALCLRESRWRMAALAGGVGLWVLGSFYGNLAWPLMDKALGLIAVGALVLLLAGMKDAGSVARLAPPSGLLGTTGWPLLTLAAALLLVNTGVWRKERLIAQGESLFVELAPVDPRSLMQGDYMRLDFAFPQTALPLPELGGKRPVVVMRRDAQGIARFVRVDDGQTPLAADERRLRLSAKDGRWVLVSDAWFFREGEAARWQAARYGEFRAEPDGTALLVDLRGAGLRSLALPASPAAAASAVSAPSTAAGGR